MRAIVLHYLRVLKRLVRVRVHVLDIRQRVQQLHTHAVVHSSQRRHVLQLVRQRPPERQRLCPVVVDLRARPLLDDRHRRHVVDRARNVVPEGDEVLARGLPKGTSGPWE
ncbi:hypothetical protein EXIGLDRAFT_220693 [Exidia glandulosa HHB12029]|uniref:Uncharacterized protein n=1 Tax=Exidia glandulosa HHB12029 TaxID=1314781 RepID=A0A165MQ27_EXIGL|nr:hypothetical protein EXIGLDRAFT_220693 [Exidia glandulosa HHB12029]